MKWSITYFYNVRYMKPNQLPLSTAMYPPKWFAISNKNNIIKMDKNNVIIGLTAKELVPQLQCECPCNKKDYTKCEFLKQYNIQLSKISFKEFTNNLINFCEKVSYITKINIDEIILLVFEKPENLCSERTILKKWFKENGIELNEMEVIK